ncbi:lysophospholipid acyltransferase family protein [Undibacterium parvum]|uniref:Glycerol acyltransferase n=1 Tax=Undibacterium parvum TaxID=401471 RepID=A0A3Q9BNS3_9BURK|nr:lysophospholipid acyltransferase family protein [Undibacterium parvum]AZP11049.1 glycerol acyltransferase [Undibacterium parvum]MCX7217708.1 lysophospholipid acyltransferase family protein [Burkholderiales bacterium]
MHYTIFDTPIINTLMRWFSVCVLRLCGWKVEGQKPSELKYVLIAAPHTSNWDFPYTMMICFALRLDVYWMGKASLFPPFFGAFSRWMGGIAVDRSRAGNLVEGTVNAFNDNQKLTVIVPPEGTRNKVTHWKTGFYYIAHGAGVPIALGYLDFKRKAGGIGKVFHTTGDIEKDMKVIQEFYAGISGKNPKQFNLDNTQT